ncbi:MAG: class I SAM-dependent methyltransferase [Planctomycetota bacterium]
MTADSSAPPLRIDRGALRKARRRHGPPGPLPLILWRQHRAERTLQRSGNAFRSGSNDTACTGYRRMDDCIFVQVNARQAWANWRSIPRSIDGRLPDRPLDVVDLCCGTGDSTAVLVWCCPAGSRFLGLDISPEFIAHAQRRRYPGQEERHPCMDFAVQSALEPFHWSDGTSVAEASMDLVNASGAVGCHFDEEACARLATNCAAVLRSDGLATIDAGPAGTGATALQRIFSAAGFRLEHCTRSNPFDRYRHLAFRRI